jgi:signal transduction histidine kinase
VALLDQPVVGDSSAFDVLVGINDALRAPLVAIHGRAELLHAGMLGQITEEQAQGLSAIHENTERAFRLLDAVQQLIAMQRDEVHIDWADFVATDLMEEAYGRVLNRAAARGHTLDLVVPESVPMARGDFYQSLLILTDLLDNAVRYTSPGGAIRLSVDSLGTHVLFSVADNGIGLRPEDIDAVGKPFWRGDYHPLVRQHPGTGLSLFVARRILALQGGELIFSGEPSVGSTFSFTLLAPT